MNDLSTITMNMVTNKAGLAAGTTTTYSTTAAPLQYAVNGKAYTFAAATNAATPTIDPNTGVAFTAQAIGTGCVYVWGINAAGTVAVFQGSTVALDVAGAFIDLPDFPVVPSSYAAFAYQLVRLAPSTATTPAVATWTMGVNNQSSVTGVTFARQDVMLLPDRPQAS